MGFPGFAEPHPATERFGGRGRVYRRPYIDGLVQSAVKWIDDKGRSRPLRLDDVLVVAPYNAQVSDLSNRLPNA